ncbi:MAG: purine-binding chemotaxis protein CheW [Deltaproteobacteria bacterium]|nr:purine-binding chemotaxis protein CheW [Deltaproteobacteria bacterium]
MAEKAGRAVESGAKSGKFLTFELDDEVYGLDILKVKEIIGIMDITSVPQSPPYMKGVLNLRGKIIPVVDLRLKFGFAEREYTERTCIIVVELSGAEGKLLVGIIVDAVSEVTNISDSDVEPTPDFGGSFTVDYIQGMAKIKGKVVILLDISRVLSASGLGQMVGAA